ncbi:hypothetical protein [Nonomuraea cypriaca]|uniref:hypothetical protein n=1 Tax=Nonomuraea cypriaca TaxID=1187855 RepID=UPI001A9CB210|nr:hypothetical protein [Nonomuraea cypriaca]
MTASAGRGLPSAFQWTSSGPLISPKPDATHDIVAVKDPTVVRHKDAGSSTPPPRCAAAAGT